MHRGIGFEVAQRGKGAVFAVRAVYHRNDNVAAGEDADDAGQTWWPDAAVMPGAIGADRQPDDLVADVFQCEGDCCGGGCVRCVYDVYEDALERYQAALKAWNERQG